MPSDLADRLQVFLDAGLLRRCPTRWQLWQGTLEMTPYVVSTDATSEERYLGAVFGHPFLRQPLIFSRVGFDHFRTGPALGASLESLMQHLLLTYHQGMPVFDLQVIQTHPDGLGHFRRRIEELLSGRSRRARRHRRLVALIFADPDEYYRRFLGEDGWIARAERLDYPPPDEEDSEFPREFYSLVDFVGYCAARFPERVSDLPLRQLPGHVASLLGRRRREGRRQGWFDR